MTTDYLALVESARDTALDAFALLDSIPRPPDGEKLDGPRKSVDVAAGELEDIVECLTQALEALRAR